MFSPTLILLARAIHILAGVYWAGAMFVFAGSILPAMRNGGGPALVPVMKQLGMRSGIAAILTILAGIYLFAALHAQDDSVGGTVLGIGALAAILAFLVAFFVNMPAGRKLGQLNANPPADPQQRAQQAAALQSRIALGARLIAALIGIAVLCMAVFRNAGLL
jgi:uncharacterized membrane protein